MGKRQEAARETRNKMILAAKKLIEEKGLDHINISDITEEAGVAKGTFYTYFKRKEDIVVELTRANFDPIEEKSRTSAGSIAEKIASFLVDSMRRIVEVGLKLAQQWLAGAVDPAQGFGAEKLRYDLNVVKDLLDKAVHDGELSGETPVGELHQWITAEYYGALACWCISDGVIDPVEILKGYCNGVLRDYLTQHRKSGN